MNISQNLEIETEESILLDTKILIPLLGFKERSTEDFSLKDLKIAAFTLRKFSASEAT